MELHPETKDYIILLQFLSATAAFIAVMPVGPGLERLFLAPGFGPSLALGLFALTTRTGIWLRQRGQREARTA